MPTSKRSGSDDEVWFSMFLPTEKLEFHQSNSARESVAGPASGRAGDEPFSTRRAASL
jgi:hypothetical protein